jgi:hypothetical protein
MSYVAQDTNPGAPIDNQPDGVHIEMLTTNPGAPMDNPTDFTTASSDTLPGGAHRRGHQKQDSNMSLAGVLQPPSFDLPHEGTSLCSLRVPWHTTQALPTLYGILSTITTLYLIGLDQGGLALNRLENITQKFAARPGILFTGCDTLASPMTCNTFVTNATNFITNVPDCRGLRGQCQFDLPSAGWHPDSKLDSIPSANLCNVTSGLYGGSGDVHDERCCYRYEKNEPVCPKHSHVLGHCCCLDHSGLGHSMFLDANTGKCERLISDAELAKVLSQYIFAVLCPLFVAGFLWHEKLGAIYKQDLYYRLMKHGAFLDFKNRSYSSNCHATGCGKGNCHSCVTCERNIWSAKCKRQRVRKM